MRLFLLSETVRIITPSMNITNAMRLNINEFFPGLLQSPTSSEQIDYSLFMLAPYSFTIGLHTICWYVLKDLTYTFWLAETEVLLGLEQQSNRWHCRISSWKSFEAKQSNPWSFGCLGCSCKRCPWKDNKWWSVTTVYIFCFSLQTDECHL